MKEVRGREGERERERAPVFPGSSRLGTKPRTPGWLVQDGTTSPSGIWSPPSSKLIWCPPKGVGKSKAPPFNPLGSPPKGVGRSVGRVGLGPVRNLVL